MQQEDVFWLALLSVLSMVAAQGPSALRVSRDFLVEKVTVGLMTGLTSLPTRADELWAPPVHLSYRYQRLVPLE